MFTRKVTILVIAAALLGGSAVSSAGEDKPTGMSEKAGQVQPAVLEQMVASAQTKSEHEAVATQFEAQAWDLESMAAKHERLSNLYRKGQGVGPKGSAASLAIHCDKLVKNLRASAAEARELARAHREAATQASN
jgi:hypothetical protein